MLLNYQTLDNEQKMIQIRQKLLWQDDLQESDFKTFYDIVFYKPFSTDSKHTIYNKHQQLSYDFVSMCYENFGQENDTCLYGEVWLDVSNSSRSEVKNWLLYLAENYPQSHIFQALWDYYKSQNLNEKAKTYYLKAVSLSSDISQKDIIEKKLISEIK
jgi:NAD+--asparagine ADP-ribosyltransferase